MWTLVPHYSGNALKRAYTMSDVAGKASGPSASGSTDLVPNMSDGFATGAGAAGFETNDKTYAPSPGAGSHGGTNKVDASLDNSQQTSRREPGSDRQSGKDG